MAAPNPHINAAIQHCRVAAPTWQRDAAASLEEAAATKWGRMFLGGSPAFRRVNKRLGQAPIDIEERIDLTQSVEYLYTFSSIINRTRRRDIGEFTTRKPETVLVDFTPSQKALHDHLLDVIARILTLCHGQQNVKFMMTTFRRQAASCLYGLAPLFADILNGKLDRLEELEANDSDQDIDGRFPSKIKEDVEALLVQRKGLPSEWAVGVTQRNSNADRFLAGLAITEWDVDEFVDLLVEKASDRLQFIDTGTQVGPDIDFMKWLSEDSSDWHQRLYALLYVELGPNRDFERLSGVRIVRLISGQYNVGRQCFFPSDPLDRNEVLPRIDVGVFTSGKSKTQQENARNLLEALGVRDVGEAEQVEAILKERYTRDTSNPTSKISSDSLLSSKKILLWHRCFGSTSSSRLSMVNGRNQTEYFSTNPFAIRA